MKSVPDCLVIGMAFLGMSAMSVLGQAQSQAVGTPWQVSTRMGGVYTDNRDATSSNKQSNLDGIVEPRVDYRYQDADRTSAKITLLPVMKWHSNPRTAAEGSAQNDQDLFGAVELELMHRPTPTITLNAADTVSYNDDPQIADGGETVRQSESYVRNTAQASVDAAQLSGLGTELDIKSETTRYRDDNVAQESDSDLLSGGISPYYGWGSGWTVFGLAEVSEFNHAKAATTEGYSLVMFDAGVNRTFNPVLFAKVMGGYQTIQYNDSDLASENMLNGHAELVFQDASMRFNLGAGYEFLPPSDSAYSSQKATTLSGAFDYVVVPDRITVGFESHYMESRYATEGVESGGTEKMNRIGTHCTYYWTPQWSLIGGYYFENWDSDVRDSYHRNLVEISVRIAEW